MPKHQDSAKIRRTAKELARRGRQKLPIGEEVWELTNEIRLPHPLLEVRGRFRKDVVHYVRNGKQFRRRYVQPLNANTERQLSHFQNITLASKAWKDVTATERKKWGEYAAQYLYPEMQGMYLGGVGQQLFNSAQVKRLTRGDEMDWTAPVAPPPPRPLRVTQVPAPEGMVAWQIEHTLAEPEGYVVQVKMTPPTPNGRAPRDTDRRLAGVTTAGSFFPLAETGAQYLLSAPRFPVALGDRYGLWVQLQTAEGVAGEELYVDVTVTEVEESGA